MALHSSDYVTNSEVVCDVSYELVIKMGSAVSDLEKAASGACGHFVGNHAILRTFWVKYPVVFVDDGGRRVKEGELRFEKGDLW